MDTTEERWINYAYGVYLTEWLDANWRFLWSVMEATVSAWASDFIAGKPNLNLLDFVRKNGFAVEDCPTREFFLENVYCNAGFLRRNFAPRLLDLWKDTGEFPPDAPHPVYSGPPQRPYSVEALMAEETLLRRHVEAIDDGYPQVRRLAFLRYLGEWLGDGGFPKSVWEYMVPAARAWRRSEVPSGWLSFLSWLAKHGFPSETDAPDMRDFLRGPYRDPKVIAELLYDAEREAWERDTAALAGS